jgi:dTDP-4-amino-4,6-dideoxygalactose transaminase
MSSELAINGGPAALKAPVPQWPVYDGAEEKALLDVLRSGHWGSTSGDVVATFEREFAAAQQAAYGICVSNGTLAIAAALRAAGVGIGDEVIVPPYTFIATASAALFVGAVPVFADVDPRTHLLDPESMAAAITERTRAVIPVHLAGRPADLDEIIRRAGDLAVIEDSAQAAGAEYRGRAVGAIGTAGTFSFQSSKNLTAGEGGAVVTDDEAFAAALYGLVNVGRVPDGGWYQHEMVGYNLRLTEFQAALLRVGLGRHTEQQALRERNARLLTELLGKSSDILLAPEDDAVTAHGRHLFLLRVPALAGGDRRAAALQALKAEGVGAASGYIPLHRNEALLRESKAIAERLGQPYPELPCPNADTVSRDTMWLPQTYLLGDEEFTHGVADAILKVVRVVGGTSS